MSRLSIRSIVAGALIACSTLAVAAAPPPAKHAAAKPLIDINSASPQQLKTLPGIGDEQAKRIIAGRPYLSKADLVTSKVLPAGTYVSIKRAIVARQPAQPAKAATPIKAKGA